VRVITAPVDAEAGRGSGQVQMVTRSGTNQYRGSLFWTNRNSALDASNWFNNFNGVAKNYENRNQFGGRIAGPIIKNKTFFFVLVDEQRDILNRPSSAQCSHHRRDWVLFVFSPGPTTGTPFPTIQRSTGAAIRSGLQTRPVIFSPSACSAAIQTAER